MKLLFQKLLTKRSDYDTLLEGGKLFPTMDKQDKIMRRIMKKFREQTKPLQSISKKEKSKEPFEFF